MLEYKDLLNELQAEQKNISQISQQLNILKGQVEQGNAALSMAEGRRQVLQKQVDYLGRLPVKEDETPIKE